MNRQGAIAQVLMRQAAHGRHLRRGRHRKRPLGRGRRGERRRMVGRLVTIGARLPGRSDGPYGVRCTSCKCLRGRPCCVFDRSRVVILVPGQGCPSGERLLAIRVRAFVGSLARMNSPMPRQRAGVTEGLHHPLSVASGLFSAGNGEDRGGVSPFHNARTGEAFRPCEPVGVQSEQISE